MSSLISFSPLMRSSVGFDRFNDLFQNLVPGSDERFDTYPPYNIEKLSDDTYRIVMAVAGFSENELDIVAQRDTLTVTGQSQETPNEGASFLHKGIAARAFQRSFRLADYIKVKGAEMRNGLLTINLAHEVPEEAKPRMITIKNAVEAKPASSDTNVTKPN